MVFGHVLLGSHNFMVTALGLCVKWPLYLMSPKWCAHMCFRINDQLCSRLKVLSVIQNIKRVLVVGIELELS